MAYCINCDCLISDNPEHVYGPFCDEECKQAYRAGASQEKLAAAEKADISRGSVVVPQIDRSKAKLPDITGFSLSGTDTDKVNE